MVQMLFPVSFVIVYFDMVCILMFRCLPPSSSIKRMFCHVPSASSPFSMGMWMDGLMRLARM